MIATSFGRQDGSTRGFTTLDPERQGVLFASLAHPGSPKATLPATSPLRAGAPRASLSVDSRGNASRRPAGNR